MTADWSRADEAILRDHYPRLGSRACREALPHKSSAAIAARVAKIGLYYRAPYKSSAHTDAMAAISSKPPHVKGIEQFSDQWFLACNKAFVKAFREEHPFGFYRNFDTYDVRRCHAL